MAVPIEQFVKQLEDSGVLAAETLKDFLPPKSEPKDAEDLARELVRQKKLTKFQAQEVWRGQGKSLFLGNYTILDKIGAGGMGQVFKAEHRRMHRIVAVKMLPAGMMQNAAIVARFEREVMAAAKLNHPNIVTAFDADNANGVHLLIMEYVDGSDLAAVVKKHGPFSVEQAVNYTLQAARGLAAAHAEGIVHRDIKPANLLLDKQGTVKILDMGLARLSADVDADKQAGLTNTGTIMGTVDYMAPEQALDTKSADARADIYSLGCSLFYLLTGKATYQGDTLMKKLLAHREQPIPSIQAIRPEVPETVEAAFRRMVAKSVDDRYQTTTEVIADLERLGTRQEPSARMQPPLGSSTDTGLTDFLRDISLSEPAPVRRKKSAGLPAGKDKKKLLQIGGGILGLLVLALAIWSLSGTRSVQTADGKKQSAKLLPVDDESEVAEVNRPYHRFTEPDFVKWEKRIAALSAEQQVKAIAQKLQELNSSVLGSGFDGIVMPKIEKGVVTELAFITDKAPDISPVRALKGLHTLQCGGVWAGPTTLSDLSPLEGMKLTHLAFQWTGVTDLTPLQEMPLTYLDLRGAKISDLSALKGMPLTNLSCLRTSVSDLTPLTGMPLIHLDCQSTKVKDLTPLQGTGLRVLVCTDTPVADLSPLEGLPLIYLNCHQTAVSDFAPLKAVPIKELYFDFSPERDTEILRSIKTLEIINNKSVPEFWADLPAAKEVEAVTKKLKEVNPGFDGKIAHTIEEGVVTQLTIMSGDSVSDISPVTALTGLRSLECRSRQNRIGKLADLAPLKGLPLTHLSCSYSAVSDLAPLRGMPLIELYISSTLVSDLSPLDGMHLTGLHCQGSRVADLSPLHSMPLAVLEIQSTLVSDLLPLKGMPLKVLYFDFPRERETEILRSIKTLETINNKPVAEFWKEVAEKQKGKKPLAFETPSFDQWMKDVATMPAEKQVEAVAKKLQHLNPGFDGKLTHKIVFLDVTELGVVTDNVTDISPVRALVRLKSLTCAGSDQGKGKLADLSPLNGMHLTQLEFSYTQVADLSPLKGMLLTQLIFHITQISDLSPLKGMPLTHLRCSSTQISDLSPLKGMPLKGLQCSGTPVSELSALRGMALTKFECSNTTVSDLSALKGMPLTDLFCSGTQVFDLSLLKDLPLKNLWCDFKPERDTEILRSIRTLETINDKPAAEFWKEVEAQQSGNKP